MYFLPKPKRENKLDPQAKLGVFVGFDKATVTGYRVVPAHYDVGNSKWELSKAIVATTVRLFEATFPLKSRGPAAEILQPIPFVDTPASEPSTRVQRYTQEPEE